jgi:hypothetical protein
MNRDIMQTELAPPPLIDLKQAARMLGMSEARASAHLKGRDDYPVATYRGRLLWLSDTVHDAIPIDPEQAARAAYEAFDAQLRNGEASA